MNVLSDTATYIIDTTCLTAYKGKYPSAAHSGVLIMKKIPPGGSSHYGSGFTPYSPGYSYGDVHDSPPYAPSYPEFKPIITHGHSPHPPRSHKPTYASLFKGVFSASSSPKVKPAHSHPPPSHIYHGPSHPYSSYPGPQDLSSMELDYDPTVTSHHHGAKYPEVHGSAGSGTNYGPPPSHDMHSTLSDSYAVPPSASALSSNPPSTKYGYPVRAVEPFKNDNIGHSDAMSYQNVGSAHQVADTYNNQPTNFAEQTNPAHNSHVPAQIHITPTTNFIEYTNIQSADSPQHQQQQHSQPPPPQSHSHIQQHNQQHTHQAPTTSQQMAEEVIKYLGNLQQGAANNKNPQLFFGMNVPLDGHGAEVEAESFPIYPSGTNPQHSGGHQIFAPTPLPEDNAPYYPPSGDYSAEQISTLFNHNTNTQYPTDSYGNPLQISKSLHKNHQNYNNHNNNNDHVQFLKPPPSKSPHHSNGASSSTRHKTNPEFDIVRSVSYEFGAAGPIHQ